MPDALPRADRELSVGDQLPSLSAAAINRTTLALFAGASGDHVPLHIDIDYARKAGMPDVFAHGMLSMAYLARLLTLWMPQSQLRRFSGRFVAITHLGNEVRCRGEVAALENIQGETCARINVVSENQFGQIKMLGEALVAIGTGAAR